MKLEVLHDVERPEGWSYQLEVTAKSAKKGRQKSKILLDAGDFGENDINLDKAAKSNYVVITHLHKDHSQHLEKLVDHPDFNGKIIMSDEAYENLKWKLQYRERDKSLNEIQKKYKKEIKARKKKILTACQGVKDGQKFAGDGVDLRFYHNDHTFGAMSVDVEDTNTKKRVFYTSDIWISKEHTELVERLKTANHVIFDSSEFNRGYSRHKEIRKSMSSKVDKNLARSVGHLISDGKLLVMPQAPEHIYEEFLKLMKIFKSIPNSELDDLQIVIQGNKNKEVYDMIKNKLEIKDTVVKAEKSLGLIERENEKDKYKTHILDKVVFADNVQDAFLSGEKAILLLEEHTKGTYETTIDSIQYANTLSFRDNIEFLVEGYLLTDEIEDEIEKNIVREKYARINNNEFRPNAKITRYFNNSNHSPKNKIISMLRDNEKLESIMPGHSMGCVANIICENLNMQGFRALQPQGDYIYDLMNLESIKIAETVSSYEEEHEEVNEILVREELNVIEEVIIQSAELGTV